MSDAPPITIDRSPDRGLATLTLNRPDDLNPLDWSSIRALQAAIAELEQEPDVAAVILTGAGRAFSAGGDLKKYIDLYDDPDRFADFLDDFQSLCSAIERSHLVFVVAVNGVTVAGGLELMLACDVVVAAASARIGDGHLNFAQLPGAGGSQRLPRAVGSLWARRLILTGELLDADAAEKIGLVTQVTADTDLIAVAQNIAAAFKGRSRTALRTAKALINTGLDQGLRDGLAMEKATVHRYATTEADAMEGLVAFAEKRPPRFRDT